MDVEKEREVRKLDRSARIASDEDTDRCICPNTTAHKRNKYTNIQRLHCTYWLRGTSGGMPGILRGERGSVSP